MPTTKKTKSLNTLSIGPAVPPDVAKREFVKSFGKSKDDGANNPVEKFLAVMDAVQAAQASFTLSDVCYFAKPFALGSETKPLFQKWCDVMQGLHKITVVEGCYDEPLIVLV